MKVKVTKIDISEKPFAPTPKKEDYVCGKDNGNVSLPQGYTIVGTLFAKIEPNMPLVIDRCERNGEKVDGFFISSPLRGIRMCKDHAILETDNSKYKFEILEK